jgi:hypothetical protein
MSRMNIDIDDELIDGDAALATTEVVYLELLAGAAEPST